MKMENDIANSWKWIGSI